MNKLILLFVSCYSFSFSQNGPVAAGTSTNGAGGSVSYSIGQIDYIAPTGSGGNTNEGLQQPYELFVVATAVTEKNKAGVITIFPNPATHSVMIDLGNNASEGFMYELTDGNGKILLNSKIKDRTGTINVSELSSGIYFITISSNSSKSNTYKLIKH